MNADDNNQYDIKSERVKLIFAETAKKMIQAEGVESVSVRKVAKLAGYSFATIYNHFKNIDELLWYARNMMILDIIEHLQKSHNEQIDSVDGVIAIFKAYIDYYIQNPNIFRFFYFHHLDSAAKPAENIMDGIDMQKQYIGIIEFLSKNGKFANEEIFVLIKTLIYSVHGMLMLYISDNDDLKVEDVYQDLNNIVCLITK